MAVLGVTKRKSDQISTTSDEEQQLALSAMSTQLAPRNGEGSQCYRSPIKKRRIGITAAQKQALIENLQLESMSRTVPMPAKVRRRNADRICSHRACSSVTLQL